MAATVADFGVAAFVRSMPRKQHSDLLPVPVSC